MLQVPFIGQFIYRYVKREDVADSVDLLNYYWTAMLLAFLSLMISAKQYFGQPIQCWVPMEFRGGWEKYAEDYCFIQNSYYVPFEEAVPEDLSKRGDQISYYRWVPVVLAIQALMFFIPNWFWSLLHKQTALSPKNVLREAMKCRTLSGADRDSEIANLAEYMTDKLAHFEDHYGKKGVRRSGHNAVLLYLLTKLLYLGNIMLQVILLDHFLGHDYFYWGYTTLVNVIYGREWQESPIFPRVIMCDFQVRRLANIQRHTVQCVIMMNMINEKLYLFLWCWLLLVGTCTVVNCLYYLIVLGIPQMRSRLVMYHLPGNVAKLHSDDVYRFVHSFLRADGVLLLQFVREHVGGRVTRELVTALWVHFEKQQSLEEPEMLKHHHNTTPEPPSAIGNYYGNLGQPSALFSSPKNFNSLLKSVNRPVTAPYLEDFIDDGTMRIDDEEGEGSSRSSKKEQDTEV